MTVTLLTQRTRTVTYVLPVFNESATLPAFHDALLAATSTRPDLAFALAHGAEVYDLRGITDTLDPDDPHVGLIQFKVGTGGEAVEYAGEWDLPLNRAIYKAFELYLTRRG